MIRDPAFLIRCCTQKQFIYLLLHWQSCFIQTVSCRELSSTFARLCHLVDSSTSEMEHEMKQLDLAIATLEELSGAAKLLKNKANYLINELNMFDKAYLIDKSSSN